MKISAMKNTDLLALAIKAKDGATAHPEITLTQNTPAKIQTDLSAAQAAAAFQGSVAAIVPFARTAEPRSSRESV